TAANGRAALEKFAPGAFDLVITDRAMPEMGGDELAAALKELAPTQPILMLTGFSDMMDANEEKPAGVDRVLGKPPTLAAFRAAVVELTGR
ncbi:MAG: response regulator, partial [Armatimonadetes bacterium]|nr:response regulator [Armatimonadota bacterium]